MKYFRPYKSDVRQITELVNLGCNETDICTIIGISNFDLEHWKKKNQQIEIILKPKPRPEFTVNHPDYATMVEEAFTCGGKRFYRFKEEYRMPTGRYKYFYAFLREVDLRASLETLRGYIDEFKKVLNGGKGGKSINVGAIWELVLNLETRTKLAFEPMGVKNLAAVSYFDDTEDLTTFSTAYGKEKIKLWEDHNVLDFFLMKPIGELLNLNNTSIESLQEYLIQSDQILQDLNSGLLKVSEENL
jgi:hypothetical protein